MLSDYIKNCLLLLISATQNIQTRAAIKTPDLYWWVVLLICGWQQLYDSLKFLYVYCVSSVIDKHSAHSLCSQVSYVWYMDISINHVGNCFFIYRLFHSPKVRRRGSRKYRTTRRSSQKCDFPNIILGCQEQHNSLFCIQVSVLLHNNAETINGLHHVDADTDNVDLSRP